MTTRTLPTYFISHGGGPWPFTVMSSANPPMIYDYSGFPEHTYGIKYTAPGLPQTAERVRGLIESAGLPEFVGSRSATRCSHSANRCRRSADDWTKRRSLLELRGVLDTAQRRFGATAPELDVATRHFGTTMHVSRQADCPALG